jgi:RNase P/RNase MRP subunit p29
MNKKMVVLCISLAGALATGSLVGCSNQNDSSQNTSQSKNSSSEDKLNLQQYSKDPDSKQQGEDFDLIGTLEKETNNELTIVIDGEKVKIPKSKSFKKEKDTPKDIDGKQVNVEIDAKNNNAESLELTPQAKADSNGIYEKDADGDYSIIGKLINETDNDVTIEVSSGKKTYKKSKDFEKDDDNMPGDSKNKVVRLEVKKNDEVESLEVDPEDQ